MKYCVWFCSIIFGGWPGLQGAVAAPIAITGQQQPLAAKSLVLDITPVGNNLMAVGERGHILRLSPDGSWQQLLSPTRNLLTRIIFIDQQQGWAVGHDATVLHSVDGGDSWQQQYHSQTLARPLLDVHFRDEQNGLAVGAYGLFLRTHDGGQHWQREFHGELLGEDDRQYLQQLQTEDPEAYQQESDSILPHFNRLLALSDGRLLLVGEMGLAAVSDDFGQHWQRLDIGYQGSLFAALEAQGQVYVAGLRGNLFVSDVTLQHWQPIPLSQQATINGMAQLGEQLWLTGNSGVVIQLDKNHHSRLVRQLKGENLLTLAADKTGKVWLAGTKGLQPITLK
ncbi:WD40/YVTN/BNR-like repeat-containing protein [Shewanella sp. YIC-542]|uniref:WD40/YVTN/BNR-like repeat-containing protein n=1 Tax=Shewanella mytili TaxID=3377111 RepID=UPI00398F2E67